MGTGTNKTTYSYFGHIYAGKVKDGYAVCDSCGAIENSNEAAKLCPRFTINCTLVDDKYLADICKQVAAHDDEILKLNDIAVAKVRALQEHVAELKITIEELEIQSGRCVYDKIKAKHLKSKRTSKMKSDELRKALEAHEADHGICDVNISLLKPVTEKGKKLTENQQYLMGEPAFIVAEEGEKGWEISIRDWPY